jgi:ribose transport system substrate-binding protein
MNRLLATTTVFLCAFLLGACGKRDQHTNTGKLILAVIPKGTTHEFWKSIHAGAEKAAEEDSLEIIWKGPIKEDDREGQISVVEDFTSRGVAGIILAPLDEAALRQPVANAMRSGIPVVIIDSDLQGNDYISFVATDNYLGGKLAGERMTELLGGKGSVIMLRYHEGSASTTKREQGFLDAISRSPGIKVVSSNQYGGATTETAYKASENLIAPLKGADGRLTVSGIFTPNESTTFGMLRALQDGGFAGGVRFIGFDSSVKLVEALEKGQIDGLILQNPMRMGYLGVKTMVAHLKGHPTERRVDTGVTLVTRENMNQIQVKELLEPDLSRWIK